MTPLFPSAAAPIGAEPDAPRPLPPPIVRLLPSDPRAWLPAGYVLTRAAEDALLAAYAAHGGLMTDAIAMAAVGAPLPIPAGLPRFPGEGRPARERWA